MNNMLLRSRSLIFYFCCVQNPDITTAVEKKNPTVTVRRKIAFVVRMAFIIYLTKLYYIVLVIELRIEMANAQWTATNVSSTQ